MNAQSLLLYTDVEFQKFLRELGYLYFAQQKFEMFSEQIWPIIDQLQVYAKKATLKQFARWQPKAFNPRNGGPIRITT